MASSDWFGPVQLMHLRGEIGALSRDAFRKWRRRRPTAFSEAVVVASSLIVIGALYYGVPVSAWMLYRSSPRMRLLVLLGLVFAVYHPLRRSSKARSGWFWEAWIDYITPMVVLDGYRQGQRPPRHSVFAMSPHGIFPFAQALTLVGSFRKIFGDLRPVAATVSTRAPGLRHLLGITGVVPAEPAAMRTALRRGDSLMIVPGGIAEMYKGTSTRSSTESFIVRNRTGFVRIAIEEGSAIVPVVVLGASRLMTLVPYSRLLQPLGRMIRASLLLFWGRWGLPIPHRKPLLYAVGPPIWPPPVGPNGAATEETIKQVHAAFVAELERLYYKYRGVYGWANKPLQIL
jgi:2-acylglycerol O-acyltransferase 2